MNGKSVILFDGNCDLCSGLVQFLMTQDENGKFSFIPTQSTEGRALIETFGLSRAEFDTVLLIEGDTIYQQSDAALRILQRFPFPYNLVAVLRIFPRAFRDSIYRLVAANRYRWIRNQDSCFIGIPVQPEPRRKFQELGSDFE